MYVSVERCQTGRLEFLVPCDETMYIPTNLEFVGLQCRDLVRVYFEEYCLYESIVLNF
jgi:hypothetical protein